MTPQGGREYAAGARASSAGEESFNDEGGGAQRDGVGAEAANLDGHMAEGVAKCVGRCGLANLWKQFRPEKVSDPATDHDSLGIEEVHEIPDAGTQKGGGFFQDGRRRLIAPGGGQQILELPVFVVRPNPLPPRALRPARQDRARTDVRFQATISAAPAAAATDHDAGVTPFAGTRGGATIECAVVEEGRPDPRAEQDHRDIAGVTPGPEPHLGAPHGLRAVVQHDGSGKGGLEQLEQRNLLPAEAWRRDVFLAIVNHDPGHANPDAKHVLGRYPGFPQRLVDALRNQGHERRRRLLGQAKWLLNRSQLAQR